MPKAKRGKSTATAASKAPLSPADEAAQSDYIWFWKMDAEHGWACQWYSSSFTDDAGVEYLTAEHYMMACKAALFGDESTRQLILKEKSPRKVKALGRKVTPFEEEKWLAERENIVLDGSRLKFAQHKDLRDKLLETGTRVIVEASPLDRVWGIGFGAKNALARKEDWGLNLLGKALMQVREELQQPQAPK